jgi:kelch-like protein 10
VNYIQTYETRADRRVKTEKIDQPAPQANHGTAEFKMHVVGTLDGADYLNSCRCFDAVMKTWHDVPSMLRERGSVGLAAAH